jgi:hypothetical protein
MPLACFLVSISKKFGQRWEKNELTNCESDFGCMVRVLHHRNDFAHAHCKWHVADVGFRASMEISFFTYSMKRSWTSFRL